MILEVSMGPMEPIFLLLFGLVIGSFLNVVIYRLPKRQSIVRPRSRCAHCRKMIRWHDNIPVLSFLILGGKCRHCKKSISVQYPLVEILTALLSCAVYWKFGNPRLYFLYFLLLIAPLVAITFIDLKHKVIPNSISIPGIPVGVLVSFLAMGFSIGVFAHSLAGIIAGGGTLFAISWIYEKIRRREGIGMGDVKLAAMLGAFFGWKGVFFVLFTSSLLGSLAGLLLVLFYRKGLHYEIPFGPFLAAGGILYLFLGPELIRLYLQATQVLYN